jgi:hypothetical protein
MASSSLSLEARLAGCAVARSSPTIYLVLKVIEVIEKTNEWKKNTAGNRWVAIKKIAENIVVSTGPKKSVCVDEENLGKLLMLLKESENKTLALSTRGHLIDETKVRLITLHADDEEISVQVKHFYSRKTRQNLQQDPENPGSLLLKFI